MMHPMDCAKIIKAELHRCSAICQKKFGWGPFPLQLRWDVRGSVAGRAWHDKLVRFNLMLLREQPIDQVRMVAAHEFAHIATFKRWAEEVITDFRSQLMYTQMAFNEESLLMSKYDKQPLGHGPEWAAMIQLFGFPPEQYHKFNTEWHERFCP